MLMRTIASAIATLLAISCSQPTPRDAELAREATTQRADEMTDTIPGLIEPRVPQVQAGDSGWLYQEHADADMDGDGDAETVVLMADVQLDGRGRPLWEDGHQWQVYVRESSGAVTRLYARFLPNGRLTAALASPEGGTRPTLVLIERTPDHVGVFEFRYLGPGRSDVWRRLDRRIPPEGNLSR